MDNDIRERTEKFVRECLAIRGTLLSDAEVAVVVDKVIAATPPFMVEHEEKH